MTIILFESIFDCDALLLKCHAISPIKRLQVSSKTKLVILYCDVGVFIVVVVVIATIIFNIVDACHRPVVVFVLVKSV